jgi:mono/diheme cytochrome c family protein
MSRLLSILIATLLMAPASPVAHATAQPTQNEIKARAAGRVLYVEHCASCHGASGRGDGPAAGSLRNQPSDLTRYAQKNGGVFPSEQLRGVIDGRGVGAHGSVEMPVWGSVFKASGTGGEAVTRGRIDAIVAYLQSLQQRSGD